MNKKAISFVLALVMMLTCVANATAFAKETNNSDNSSISAEGVDSSYTTYADRIPMGAKIPYGKDYTILKNEPFRNQEFLGYLALDDDPRTHRVILLVDFEKLTTNMNNCNNKTVIADNGLGEVQLTLIVKFNGQTKTYVRRDSATKPWQFEITGVPSGASLQITADASTAPGSTSNGNYRSILIKQIDAYFD